MSDPNELLRDLRADMGLEVCPEVPTEIWRRLDAACKAGNLPDEWLPHELLSVVPRRLAHERGKRIAKLEAEIERLQMDFVAISEASGFIKCADGEWRQAGDEFVRNHMREATRKVEALKGGRR